MKSFLIGSLPHQTIEEALAYSFSFTIPTLVTLPKIDENEFMVDQAMREIDGYELVRHSLREKDIEYKTPLKFLSAELFFKRAKDVYKWQACGPLTLLSALEEHPDRLKIIELYFEKIIRTQKEFNLLTKAKALFFLDEPVLAFFQKEAGLLESFLARLRQDPAFANISFGLHACSKVSPETLKTLPFDLYALDPSLYAQDEWARLQNEFKEKLTHIPVSSKGEPIACPKGDEVFASSSCGLALADDKTLQSVRQSLNFLD